MRRIVVVAFLRVGRFQIIPVTEATAVISRHRTTLICSANVWWKGRWIDADADAALWRRRPRKEEGDPCRERAFLKFLRAKTITSPLFMRQAVHHCTYSLAISRRERNWACGKKICSSHCTACEWLEWLYPHDGKQLSAHQSSMRLHRLRFFGRWNVLLDTGI